MPEAVKKKTAFQVKKEDLCGHRMRVLMLGLLLVCFFPMVLNAQALPEEQGSDPEAAFAEAADVSDQVMIDEAETEEEEDLISEILWQDDAGSEDAQWASGDGSNASGDTDALVDADGWIEDPEFADGEGLLLAEAAGDDSESGIYRVEEEITITIDDPIVTNPNDATPTRGRRLMKSASGSVEFTNFYDQLEDPAKAFYNLRKTHFADNRKTVELDQYFACTQTEANDTGRPLTPYTFTCNLEAAETDDEGNVTSWVINYTDGVYQEAYEMLLYYVRSSFDAFYYDHPEVFWTRSTGLRFGFSYAKDTDRGIAKYYLTHLVIAPVVAYTGASGQVAAFDSAVDAVAEQIASESEYDGDGTVSEPEMLQGIHDFLARKCYYDNAGLSSYQTTKDYSIFTPGPVFLSQGDGSAGVVCEGYSRAFKILCDKLGIECAIVSGKAHPYSSIGHAWNAVRLNGNWYMVDSTWDDDSSVAGGVKYQYYLCSLNTPNYGGNNLFDRAVNGKIGGEDTVSANPTTNGGFYPTTRKKEFIFPSFWTGQHTFEELTDPIEIADENGTCCTEHGCTEEEHGSVIYYTVNGSHEFDEGTVTKEPTCTNIGKKTYVCSHNPCHIITEDIPVEANAHVSAEAVHENVHEADCETAGSYDEVIYCSECGIELSREAMVVDALGHDWDAGTVTREPWCEAQGVKTYHCLRDETHTRTEIIDALGHDWDAGTVTTEPWCETQGERIYHCLRDEAHTRTETVDALSHEWGEWQVEKEPSVEEEGIEVRTCARDAEHTQSRTIPKLADLTGFEERLDALLQEETLLDPEFAEEVSQVIAEATAMLQTAKDGSWSVEQEEELRALANLLKAAEASLETAQEKVEEKKTAAAAEEKRKAGEEEKKRAEAQKKAQEQAAAQRKAQAQAAFRLNVKADAVNVPIQLKRTNRKIRAVVLAQGDSLVSAVSSDPGAVSASVQGAAICLRGLKNRGKATITVMTKLGASCSFSVKVQKGKVKPKKISVAASRISLAAGSTFSLEAQVLPVTANGKLRCTSSDRKVAVVSRGGIIRAKKKGVAKITVKVGTKKKVVSVTVK